MSGACEPEALNGRSFRNRSVRATRFVGCDLSDVVVRGCDVGGMEIDSPWLLEGDSRLIVNGVDVVPLVDAELNRRFPGRELRTAEEPLGLRSAWTSVETEWAAALRRVADMPAGTVDIGVDGEWSLSQTLRHLVMATDTWLGKAVLGMTDPFHRVGLPDGDHETAACTAVATTAVPSWQEVLDARSGRQCMVRDYLKSVTPRDLAAPRDNPHTAEHRESVLTCLRTILEEEWEHLRYAIRDLDTLTSGVI